MKKEIKKKRILFCGVSLTKFSGLGYVISNFLLRFQKDGYEVGYATIIGADCDLNSMLQWNPELINILNFENVYNCQLTDQSKFFKYDDVISDFKPDIVISCLDPWQVDQIMKSAYRDTYFWLCYLTIETPKYPTYIMYPTPYFDQARKSIVEILNNVDLLIPVTQMGKKALNNLNINTYKDNIFNGIDLTKLPQKKYSKIEVFGNVVKETDFIFMTMGKNMERKKIDMIVKAFDKFLNKVNRDLKYKLYIHTDIEHATGGTDLYQLILDLNIQKHILLSHSFIQGIIMSTEDLYKRYSVCDCYITLSSGEGFNYGTCEAITNKLPVVYINYGGHAEYLKDIGLPVNVKTTYSASNAQMEWAIADTDHAAKQMARAVSDPKWREQASINGYKYAKKNFDWEIVYSKLKSALTEGYSQFKRPGIFELGLKRVV